MAALRSSRVIGQALAISSALSIWTTTALGCGPGPFIVNDAGEPTGALTACANRSVRCTLRDAVNAANQCAGRGMRTIRITGMTARLSREPNNNEPGGYARQDGRSALTINENVQVTISGGGRIERAGNNAFRLFRVAPRASLTIVGMTLSKGRLPLGRGAEGEGAAILNRGTLTIRGPRAYLVDSSATQSGGAIATYGRLEIVDAELSGNRSGIGGAGGGALFVAPGAEATLTRVKFRTNAAGSFGGAVDTHGRLTVSQSTFEENNGTDGGAITVRAMGTLDVSQSLFRANTASSSAAIRLLPNSNALSTISASTFSANRASRIGGAIEVSSGRAKLHDLTITQNSAPTGSGLVSGSSGRVEIINSIIADNRVGPSCAMTMAPTLQNPNLNDDGSCAGMSVRGAPKLQPLRLAGGATAVHLPFPGSPAIESGAGCLSVDQRGRARPSTPTASQGRCEIGAAEVTTATDLGHRTPLPPGKADDVLKEPRMLPGGGPLKRF